MTFNGYSDFLDSVFAQLQQVYTAQ